MTLCAVLQLIKMIRPCWSQVLHTIPGRYMYDAARTNIVNLGGQVFFFIVVHCYKTILANSWLMSKS